MIRRLRVRATRPELMDESIAGGPELLEAYRQLRRLNRLFCAAAPTVYGVDRLWSRSAKPQQLTVLDIGAGSGDVNRAILRWADRRGIQAVNIIIVDHSKEACLEAASYYKDEPRVKIRQCDLHALPEACADIVTATQFVHHFPSTDLPQVIDKMVRVSRLGVVVNDIHRHLIAWLAVWVTTRVITRNRYIRHDGPLSVEKGFTSRDWRELARTLGVCSLYVRWRPMFRYAAVIDRLQYEDCVERS